VSTQLTTIYPAVSIATKGKTYCSLVGCPRCTCSLSAPHCRPPSGPWEKLVIRNSKPVRRPWCRSAATEVAG